MTAYYRQRAPEYDQFYQVPEFQDDLAQLEHWVIENVRGRSVLEIAAGTGHWTKIAARVAKSVTATDANPETLAIAKRRRLGSHVTFRSADAYALPDFATRFDVGMAHLWWSHVPRERRQEFLAGFVSRLKPRAAVLMLDQRFGKSFSIPCARRDTRGNRYELRRVASGKMFEVVKNYPSTSNLHADLSTLCADIRIMKLKHFWALSAHLRN
jgi:demethylmenaquinone methyltransferase/2-methoxy-6-polyprenyl-1,4-benzoquinol methylase